MKLFRGKPKDDDIWCYHPAGKDDTSIPGITYWTCDDCGWRTARRTGQFFVKPNRILRSWSKNN